MLKPEKRILTHGDVEMWAKQLITVAKDFVKKGEQVPPALFGITTAQNHCVVPLPMSDETDKQIIPTLIEAFVRVAKVSAVILVTEGWTKDNETAERKVECILACVATPEKLTIVVSPFTRNEDNAPVFEEFKISRECASAFFPKGATGLPWPDPFEGINEAVAH